MRALELKVPPLALVALFAAAMWAASALPPRDAWAWRWRMPLAFLLAIAGGGIAMAGVAAFRKARTTVDPTKPGHASAMVTSGVYRFSRNPMYLGFLLLLLAWAVRLSHPLAFVFLPAFVLSMNRLQIAPEERALEGKFGSEFTAYRQSVRRWL